MFFPLPGDPFYTSVAVALPMDGENDSTQFPDYSLSTKTVTRTGGTVIKTTLGYPAAYFDGNGDYLTIASHSDLSIGAGDYTVELYVFVPDMFAVTTPFIFDSRPPSTNGEYPSIYFDHAGTIYYFFSNAARITSATGVIQPNTLLHVAVCRSGSTTRLFVDGIQRGSSYTNSSSIPQSRWLIGAHGYFEASQFAGYIRDFFVRLYAKYTENFTPTPARQFYYYAPNRVHLVSPTQQPSFTDVARRGL